MHLDLTQSPTYYGYYTGIEPSIRGSFARNLFADIWNSANKIEPSAFQEVCTNVVPRFTNGFSSTPTRKQIFEMFSLVRLGNYDHFNPTAIAIAIMFATRAQRWQALANALGVVPPTSFRLYRYVYDVDPFVIDVARQWEQSSKSTLGVIHDPYTAWSMHRAGAMSFQQNTRAGVLYVADIAIEDTIADILVDNSTLRNPYWRQAEMLVAAPSNTLIANATATEVVFRNKTYVHTQWPELVTALNKAGHPV